MNEEQEFEPLNQQLATPSPVEDLKEGSVVERSMWKQIVEFLKTTTAHGLSAIPRAKNRKARGFWFTIWFFFFIMFLISFYFLLSRYRNHQKSTSILVGLLKA